MMHLENMSVSPDGRWIAAEEDERGRVVNVYETATGHLAWQSSTKLDGGVARFSPDGNWMVTMNDGGRAYAVGTWEPGPQLGPGNPSEVSPDNRFVMMAQADGVYRLVELATGRELARLEDPDRIASHPVFTPDGTGLVYAVEDGLRVWDLRRHPCGTRQPPPRLGRAAVPGPRPYRSHAAGSDRHRREGAGRAEAEGVTRHPLTAIRAAALLPADRRNPRPCSESPAGHHRPSIPRSPRQDTVRGRGGTRSRCGPRDR